jgi:phage shock protein A
MKVLSSIIRWFKAKDAEASEAIEQEHEVAFAKQDYEAMQKDLSQVTNSIGEVKATLAGLKRDMADKQRAVSNLESDARSLLERGKEDLATKLCAEIETIEKEIEVYRTSIAQQENMLKTLEEKREQLRQAVHQAESSLRMMQTMDSVARATEKVTSVKVGDTSSALNRFQDRQSRLQKRLDKAKAIQEMATQDAGGTLKTEVDEALGRTKGTSVLERLKASHK